MRPYAGLLLYPNACWIYLYNFILCDHGRRLIWSPSLILGSIMSMVSLSIHCAGMDRLKNDRRHRGNTPPAFCLCILGILVFQSQQLALCRNLLFSSSIGPFDEGLNQLDAYHVKLYSSSASASVVTHRSRLCVFVVGKGGIEPPRGQAPKDFLTSYNFRCPLIAVCGLD